ncbi:MAG: hypothetical protein IPO04_15215 [Cytophagaceae bacterium]|nr:hypothetical protein [Cytophagaceae bacterium]
MKFPGTSNTWKIKICLGSFHDFTGPCTMKLNATTEMIPVTWLNLESYTLLHRIRPKGIREMIENSQHGLKKLPDLQQSLFSQIRCSGETGPINGYPGICHGDTQPGNWHLIPSSAHGTNPASAVMAGMKVVVVSCDQR